VHKTTAQSGKTFTRSNFDEVTEAGKFAMARVAPAPA
jgi:hypothetical protein